MSKQDIHLFFNKTLANYYVLHTKLYRYQWYQKGERAHLLETTMKQFQKLTQRAIEDIAEHIIFLDGKPFATMVKFIKEATISEASADDEEDEMIEQLITDVTKLINDLEQSGTYIVLADDDFYSLQFINKLLYDLKYILHQCKLFSQ